MTPESQRQLPFLKRNIARAVNAFSGAFGSPVLGRGENGAVVTENGQHPRKRRRLSTPDHDLDKLIIASPRSSDSRHMLRVEVLRCHHRDSKKIRPSFGTVVADATTRAKCRVTISDMTLGRPRVLHCDSQTCNVVTFKNPAGPGRVARVELPRPFYVPRDNLLVNRLDDSTFDLADTYKLSVEIESADGANWPPLNGQDLEDLSSPRLTQLSSRHWVFSSTFDKLYGRLKGPLTLTATTALSESSTETDYEMDVDLQWSSGYMALKRLQNGSKPCINAIDPDSPRTNGHREPPADEVMEDVGDDVHEADDAMANGERPPSRSLRTRGGEKVYNIKALSDKAHGRKGRRRKPNTSVQGGEGRVRYLLPPDQPSIHSDYEYSLETTSQGPQFHVTFQPEPPTTPSKTVSIKPPTQVFNLERFVAGDDSWRSSRLEPDTKADFITPHEAKLEFAAIASKSPSKKSFKVVPETQVPSPRSKILIPETRHVFYHPVSKQELKVGQEVPYPVVESQWFHHKHRESLNDVDGVTPAELEYIKEFDGVMREHDITARVYFPRAWLDFVRKKAGWLVEAKHRMVEFSVHESYLLASDLIRDEHIQEAIGLIEQARSGRRKLQNSSPSEEEPGTAATGKIPEAPPKTPAVRKSASGCAACGLPVLSGPHGLVCSNKDCSKRLFHSKCVPEPPATRRTKSTWLCTQCNPLTIPAAATVAKARCS
ncbi:hypothetical protein ACRE_070480 [Hapsidospora chrysogenum ATCC 11550]|uniref:Zinc finger PHD-type domain-containing protein n=1 Tax=Hapsidospora chrysogenum (strain ATCC 11550 / CBS 779.69 / DSM 880 / IAM 14645 / JCM 23072 / IMI 49137) TaxID=857340 RepID=A0A086SYQ9_HAPC1|nr:hypothetical protein ACRE_070480 [Hapsidospora chrysogenum ATCC 11550]